MDSVPEQTSGESRRLLQQCDVTLKSLERDAPWSNKPELNVGKGAATQNSLSYGFLVLLC